MARAYLWRDSKCPLFVAIELNVALEVVLEDGARLQPRVVIVGITSSRPNVKICRNLGNVAVLCEVHGGGHVRRGSGRSAQIFHQARQSRALAAPDSAILLLPEASLIASSLASQEQMDAVLAPACTMARK